VVNVSLPHHHELHQDMPEGAMMLTCRLLLKTDIFVQSTSTNVKKVLEVTFYLLTVNPFSCGATCGD